MNALKKNNTILITGATSGIGKASAERFAREGARLVLCGRRPERLAELKASLKTEVHTLALDVRDREAVQSAIAKLPDDFAAIDVLINSAGLALGLGKAPDIAPDDWQQMIDTNINGVLNVTHAALPGMVARDSGHIINLGSTAGSYPYAGANVYGATKAFIEQFSLNLRCDLLGKSIRVTNVEPGMVETEFSLVRFGGDKSLADEVYKGVQPLTAQDIAETIFWCASQPAHVNINRVEMMPVMQALAGYAVYRG